MNWIEPKHLPFTFDHRCATEDLAAARALATFANRGMSFPAPAAFELVSIWGSHRAESIDLPVLLLDARDGEDRSAGFQALLRNSGRDWLVSVLSAAPCPTSVLRVVGDAAAVHPTCCEPFGDHAFGTYMQDPTRFTVTLENNVALAAFFWELAERPRRAPRTGETTRGDVFDLMKHQGDVAGWGFVNVITKLDEIARSEPDRFPHPLGTAAGATKWLKPTLETRPDRKWDVNLSVNGLELPFVATLNVMMSVREDEVRRRIREFLEERSQDALGQIRERFDRIVQEFETRIDEAFPETREP